MLMNIKIKHKGTVITIKDNYTYTSYIDVRETAIKLIEESIKSINDNIEDK